ncbi:MAG: hypothetical protein A3I14_11170 [Candidatus Rokubacteria bacterium RIFCSPLOWO2_02_FULL_73_56]|nr:MAG: hypothetical protein A3I14_11170 [Candidatus Rokubacteria bacterium RIFCSPLOWO2_02_FULL_73_56]OGL28295.1 MAG: hypothetical protein A3G44_02680 [Candidatus Rokubacteria bacterium RIFCSPLOWO2_12_FULL_73_47]
MTRWLLAAVGALLLLGAAGVLVSRWLGRPGSRAAILVSVIAHWLGAWVLWSFAGGLALRAGLLTAWDATPFALLALAGGAWQYRVEVRAGRERGLTVFVGLQLLWLLVVLVRNGLFAPPR